MTSSPKTRRSSVPSQLLVEAEIAAGYAKDPNWFDQFEARSDIADVDELMDMLATAPTDFLRGAVYGRILFRQAETRARRTPH